MKGTTIKILLVGARYTGKGQIGREWGQTSADLPTLQPVILYDRNVMFGEIEYRVVVWVLSFDPEFEDIRACFYKDADGIIFTFSLVGDHTDSHDKLDEYILELKRVLGTLPPSVVFGFIPDEKKLVSMSMIVHERAKRWAGSHDMALFEALYTNKQQFPAMVDGAFDAVLALIFKTCS